MARPIGLSKTGGRKLGTPNKKTLVLQSVTDALNLDVPRRLGELLPELDPAKQADVLLELMSYIYPKRKAIEHLGLPESTVRIESRREDIKLILRDPEAFSAAELIEKKLEKRLSEPSLEHIN